MSTTPPAWLPVLVDTNGSWGEIVGRLYAVFDRDFKRGKATFRGLPIWWDRRCLPGDPMEEGFYHLITGDDVATGNRLLEPPRAERLAWCRSVIDHSASPEIVVFDYLEGNGRVRTYLWGKEFDYVVILEKLIRRGKDTAYSLVTAFCLDGPSRKRMMQNKSDNRI